MKLTAYFLSFFSAIVFISSSLSCDGGRNSYDDTPVVICRFDLAADTAANSDSICRAEIVARYLLPLKAIAYSMLDDRSPSEIMSEYISSPAFKVFTPDVRNIFPNLDEVQRHLTTSFGVLRDSSLSVPTALFSIVSPYNQSVIRLDSVMLISLNHYLGADYPGYDGMDAYRRRLKTPQRIPVDVTESVIRYNFPAAGWDFGNSALCRMLYEGAVLSVLKNALSDYSLADLLGYTSQEWQWCLDNEHNIWSTLASRNLLYTTSPMDVARLIYPSPATAAVHPDAPGGLGRFVGYRIVSSYLKKYPSTSLQRLFSSDFISSRETLVKAGYNP